MAVMANDSNIKALKIYYGSYDEWNLVLNVKDIVNATKKQGNLIVYIEENEEVKDFFINENTLSILLK